MFTRYSNRDCDAMVPTMEQSDDLGSEIRFISDFFNGLKRMLNCYGVVFFKC